MIFINDSFFYSRKSKLNGQFVKLEILAICIVYEFFLNLNPCYFYMKFKFLNFIQNVVWKSFRKFHYLKLEAFAVENVNHVYDLCLYKLSHLKKNSNKISKNCMLKTNQRKNLKLIFVIRRVTKAGKNLKFVK